MQIFIHRNNVQTGPFTEAEVRAQLAAGTISLHDHAWWEGQSGWVPLGQTPFVAPAALAPPVYHPPVPPPGQPGIRPAASIPETSALAIWSLICGPLSLFCSLLTAIPAVILGHMALSEISRKPHLKGAGMALTGLIFGYLFIGLFFISLTAMIILRSMGNQVKDVFNQINQQMISEQNNPSSDSDSSSTNADQSPAAPNSSTNAPDSGTNAAPVVNP